MNAGSLVTEGAARLTVAGIENARSEARLLLALALGVGREETLSNPTVTPEQMAAFVGLLARRAAREPLAYIAGHKEFRSLDFAVGPGVLVPRPETETLIEQALAFYPERPTGLAVCDLGTGSGCILIAAMKEFPGSLGLGLDCSRQAMAWARANGIAHNLPARAEMRLDPWDAAPEGAFDLVFCNPPYVRTGDIDGLEPEVALYEPHAALDGGADGLDAYRALAPLIFRMLTPGGHAFLEIGAGQGSQMEPMFHPHGLEIRALAPDLSGIPRCLVVQKA